MKCDTDYYNDLPGKMAPEFSDVCKQSNLSPRDRLPSNLIDLNSAVEHDYVNDDRHNSSDNNLSHISTQHCNSNHNSGAIGGNIRDVFDMRKKIYSNEFFVLSSLLIDFNPFRILFIVS